MFLKDVLWPLSWYLHLTTSRSQKDNFIGDLCDVQMKIELCFADVWMKRVFNGALFIM